MITYLPSFCESPSLTIRPSCAATISAFGALIRSTSCSTFACFAAFAEPTAAADGAGAAVELGGAAPWVGAEGFAARALATAAAPAVALEPEATFDGACAVESAPHATCLPETGRGPSVWPVSVAATVLGWPEMNLGRP